jgi:hypothetical protein
MEAQGQMALLYQESSSDTNEVRRMHSSAFTKIESGRPVSDFLHTTATDRIKNDRSKLQLLLGHPSPSSTTSPSMRVRIQTPALIRPAWILHASCTQGQLSYPLEIFLYTKLVHLGAAPSKRIKVRNSLNI